MFDWLADYQELTESIAVIDLRLGRSKSELKRWKDSTDLGRYKLDKKSKASSLEEQIEAMEWELALKMNDQYDISALVYTFEGLDQRIMTLRYIEGKDFKRIADDLGYSYPYIRSRHSNIIKGMRLAKKVFVR